VKFWLTLVVWGDWHLSQFEAHGLPSLRAPGNLEAVDYRIAAYTRPSDVARLQSVLHGFPATILAALPDDLKCEQATADATLRHYYGQDRADAARFGEAWMQVAPDMVWGEGTLLHHKRALEAGKKAIFRPLLRVDSSLTGTIKHFSRCYLASLALRWEHEMARTFYRADGTKFSPHAEMIIWEAPGGLLNQTVTAAVQTCNPAAVRLNWATLLEDEPDDTLEVVTDSDQVITLAMCPPDKPFLFGHGAVKLAPETVRGFLRGYSSPASSYIMRRPYRLHCEDIRYLETWGIQERRALRFASEVFSADG
jgi:hypothetical protein